MSKARARERKKKRLAEARVRPDAPEIHEAGTDAIPAGVAEVVEQDQNRGKFNTQLNKGVRGKNRPNLAASSRGASRSS